ncbi:uncharacterized protein LOC121915132 isoform X2 [Sceloporus undulatus]|nr:uncharacterized protein LOC121915132 isoform X2 [Sceloporus undulatus]
MTRIKALKSRLEAGERCLEMALPCDIATLVKQFLRALPEPLIPARLQGPLCQVQRQEDSEDNRSSLMLLVTSLLPQRSVDLLRYLFNFLQEVAARCAQNKMDLSNLAVIFAPNLFPSAHCSHLSCQAEEQLRSQAAVVQTLITHAPEIGNVPQFLLGKVQAALSDLDRKRQPSPGSEEQRERDGEGRSRRRRRSVSNFVTETLSKFKTSRSLYSAHCQDMKADSPSNTTLKTSFNSKRKASEDVAWATEVSAKKRRSGIDSLSSDPFEDDAGDPFNQPVDLGSMQDPISAAPAVSSGISNPISDMRRGARSPRSPAVKVQRKRSSSKKKRPPRKHSVQSSPSRSPTSFERKDAGRKSLRIFFRQSKDLAGEPSGWLLMKKMVTETIEGPTSQQKWAQLQSYKLKESATGSSSQLPKENSCIPASTNPVMMPHVVVKCKSCKAPRPGFDAVICGHHEMGLDGKLEKRGALDKAEDVAEEGRPVALSAKHRRPLRRSLSWSEGLSMKNATEEIDFSPEEAPVRLGRFGAGLFGLPDATQPDMEVLVAGVRQLGIPAMCVTPVDSCVPGCAENGPSNPLPSKPDLSDTHLSFAEHHQQLNEAPKSSLKRLTLSFQRASSQANEGSKVASLSLSKRKGGRRFGRSISHESGLPLQAEQEAAAGLSGHAAKKEASLQSPMSPLQSFKAYGRQIFITRKHIMMSFAGFRGKRETSSPKGIQVPTVGTPEP